VVGGSPVGQFHLRPLVFVLLSFAAFGVLIERAGLILAVLAQVAVAHYGLQRNHLSRKHRDRRRIGGRFICTVRLATQDSGGPVAMMDVFSRCSVMASSLLRRRRICSSAW